MESLSLNEKIRAFLSVSYGDGYGFGYGYGSGYGNGYGSGYGNGYGSGYGKGNGYGSGSGNGNGYGSGSGKGYGDGSGNGSGYGNGYGDIKSFNGKNVYAIDGVLTIITSVRSNIAKGFLLQSDLTLRPCYIVKSNDLFAHGKTIQAAQQALQDKLFEEMDVEERIDLFWQEFEPNTKYPVKKFYEWHNKLTGSCEMGRKAFAKDNGIDIDNGKMTVDEFIKLTQNAYGGDVIKQLADKYYNKE